jgi:hypothetical protein
MYMHGCEQQHAALRNVAWNELAMSGPMWQCWQPAPTCQVVQTSAVGRSELKTMKPLPLLCMRDVLNTKSDAWCGIACNRSSPLLSQSMQSLG